MILIQIIFWAVIFFVFHSYVFYPVLLWFFRGAAVRREKKNPNREVTISVIISAYNEESIIRQRIENLLSLDYPKGSVEILIGSDGSSDGTNAIAAEYGTYNVTLMAFPDRRGKASVLNDLALKANNEILIFSDANTFYDKDVFKNFVRHFSDETIGGVCGYLQLRSSDDNSGGKGESFYWEYENRIKELEGNYHTTFGATGAIYAIRKNLFKPLPAAIAITDDFLIPMNVVAQGYRIVYDKTVYGWEDSTSSSMKEFHRKIRISAGNFNCLKDIIHLLHPKYGFIAFGFFSHKIIRWFVPFLLVIIFLSSLFLSSDSRTFAIIFGMQLVFAGLGCIGLVLDRMSRPLKLFTLPYYFLLANLGLLIGFFRFLRGTQKAAWKATR